ncbi:MAG: gfo/Idh/MocA family oxidoreductase, partial [Segetibacter sp.]|nr:gfo/Idh/MocA family oxidoreductase [Segetibacter sp.]
MEKKVLRAGIVGSGFAAKFHYDALQRVFSTRVEIVGAYSVTAEKLSSFTKPRGLDTFNNLQDLVEKSD